MKDFKEQVDKPRKIAIYASMSTGFVSTLDVNYTEFDDHYQKLPNGQRREQSLTGYARISDVMEVKFTAINRDEIVAKAVESLDTEERKIRAELNQRLAEIRERKNQLLALTHQPETLA